MEATVIEEASTAAPPRAVKRGLPPGPRMPRVLQTAIWSRQAQWMLEQSRARFGDMFTIRIAHEGNWVMISDPAMVKQVFTGDPKVFHAGEGNQILRPILGDNSVLVLDEKPHLGQRRLLLPPFHGERMQGYERTMTEISAREIASWPTGTPWKLRPRMQAITLEIIIETVFGVHERERMDPLRAALREFLDLTTDPRFLLPVVLAGPERIRRLPVFARRIDRVDALIHREIADRRAAEDLAEREDILSMLVGARHEDGSQMSEAEIRDELLTLLVAGHETTATALSWALERLTRHPERLERLRAEVLAGEEAYLTAT
ncbi:MAG: cytochrome P450, partial [Solirubrobacterales bacterium]